MSAGEPGDRNAAPRNGAPRHGAAGLAPVALILGAIAALVAVDVASDLAEGVTLGHATLEGAVLVLAVAGLAWVALRAWSERRRLVGEMGQLRSENASWQKNAARWKAEAEAATRGFAEAVDQEFLRWGLTVAEREVALLLLKGVSLKDISGARGTAERTARQQAASVYAKAGVTGRSELASYFLDALPAPSSSSSEPHSAEAGAPPISSA